MARAAAGINKILKNLQNPVIAAEIFWLLASSHQSPVSDDFSELLQKYSCNQTSVLVSRLISKSEF